ncbi:hypothetical protein PRIPAC_84910 [Pristionchus pacificus]|uniref:Hexosyltransferase n=1 Tax=Pristionchus pacificus TaxID=54126 RepID=A0A2A6BLV5_PRIPA|nr:hypothetical protein PRIPAC_84910 [Pristionchus pacificus]|eukprot:PDM66887.1 hypothetical protein PRIPAC_48304 [Pristionchus pacificus]
MRIGILISLLAASDVYCRVLPDQENVVAIGLEVPSGALIGTAVNQAESCPDPPSANQSLHQLVNTLPINSLVLLAPAIINGDRNYALVLLVNSAEYEREDRDEIRRLWASRKESRMQEVDESVVVFLLGRSSALEEESDLYGDLLQVAVEDSYRNMVYKIEAGFRWLKESVRSDFVAKVDSDTVVHIDRLYNYLSKYEKAQSGPWFACYSIPSTAPVRDKCNPWYISESDYPYDRMPAYCNGPGYAMNRGLFELIVFEVEDAFLTGAVASDVGEIKMMVDVAFHRYTEITDCDGNEPTLSMQNTHFQLDDVIKPRKNLTAAWNWLKSVQCPQEL